MIESMWWRRPLKRRSRGRQHDECRQQKRFSSATPLTCPLGTVSDLSVEGMRVACTHKPPVHRGQELELSVQSGDQRVHIRARIIWIQRTSRNQHDIGLQFVDVPRSVGIQLATLACFGYLPGQENNASQAVAPSATGNEVANFYEVLDIPRQATTEKIRRAYLQLARKYHPDASQSDETETQFKMIHEAYQVLKDPNSREIYDQSIGMPLTSEPRPTGVETTHDDLVDHTPWPASSTWSVEPPSSVTWSKTEKDTDPTFATGALAAGTPLGEAIPDVAKSNGRHPIRHVPDSPRKASQSVGWSVAFQHEDPFQPILNGETDRNVLFCPVDDWKCDSLFHVSHDPIHRSPTEMVNAERDVCEQGVEDFQAAAVPPTCSRPTLASLAALFGKRSVPTEDVSAPVNPPTTRPPVETPVSLSGSRATPPPQSGMHPGSLSVSLPPVFTDTTSIHFPSAVPSPRNTRPTMLTVDAAGKGAHAISFAGPAQVPQAVLHAPAGVGVDFQYAIASAATLSNDPTSLARGRIYADRRDGKTGAGDAVRHSIRHSTTMSSTPDAVVDSSVGRGSSAGHQISVGLALEGEGPQRTTKLSERFPIEAFNLAMQPSWWSPPVYRAASAVNATSEFGAAHVAAMSCPDDPTPADEPRSVTHTATAQTFASIWDPSLWADMVATVSSTKDITVGPESAPDTGPVPPAARISDAVELPGTPAAGDAAMDISLAQPAAGAQQRIGFMPAADRRPHDARSMVPETHTVNDDRVVPPQTDHPHDLNQTRPVMADSDSVASSLIEASDEVHRSMTASTTAGDPAYPVQWQEKSTDHASVSADLPAQNAPRATTTESDGLKPSWTPHRPAKRLKSDTHLETRSSTPNACFFKPAPNFPTAADEITNNAMTADPIDGEGRRSILHLPTDSSDSVFRTTPSDAHEPALLGVNYVRPPSAYDKIQPATGAREIDTVVEPSQSGTRIRPLNEDPVSHHIQGDPVVDNFQLIFSHGQPSRADNPTGRGKGKGGLKSMLGRLWPTKGRGELRR